MMTTRMPGRAVASAVVGGLFAALLSVAAAAAPAKLTLLHVNDVYQISPSGGHGGLAELMTLMEQERARSENTVATFGGDLLSPSVMSGLTKGEQMINLFNAMGIDVGVFGNHEFDFGNDILAQRISQSQFPWLATNVKNSDGAPFGGADNFWTTQVGDFTVGFFGLLTPETDVLSSPGAGVAFEQPLAAAQAAVDALREQGADVVIALTHLTIAEDREIAANVNGLDVILGGHEHVPITFYEGGVLIHKSGTDAQFLGVVELEIDEVERRGRTRIVVRPQWRMVSTRGVDPDPDIGAMVAKYNQQLDEQLNIAVGQTATELESVRASVRTKETTMGNLIADAIRAGVGADVAISNGGGIRGDTTYPAGTTLTRKDILTELPFGNTTVLIELSGADLKAALENGVSRVEDVNGRFPQVSGMTYVFDMAKDPGTRIVDVKVGGRALDSGRIYKLATNNFIAGGGDGYGVLANGETLIDGAAGTLMATMVMDYITAEGTVAPSIEGRIVRRN